MAADVLRLDALPDVLTVGEVAEVLRCDPDTVYALVKAGDLSVVRLGRAYRVTRPALLAFLGLADGDVDDELPGGTPTLRAIGGAGPGVG